MVESEALKAKAATSSSEVVLAIKADHGSSMGNYHLRVCVLFSFTFWEPCRHGRPLAVPRESPPLPIGRKRLIKRRREKTLHSDPPRVKKSTPYMQAVRSTFRSSH